MNRATQVTIIGAGPVGLSLSILLSRANIPNLIIERNSNFDRQRHPQAHFLNFRTMEIFKNSFDNSLYRDIISKSQPIENWRDFVYCSSVLGREFARVNNFSGGNSPARLADLSPVNVCHLSQSKLHPLLVHRAKGMGTEFWMNSRVAELEETGAGVKMRVQTADGGECVLDSAFVAACDGAHSTTRDMLGIDLQNIALDEEPTTDIQALGHLVNIHFTCSRLGEYLLGERKPGMLYFVYNEKAVVVLVAHDVRSGDWVCQVPYFPPHQTLKKDFHEAACLKIIQSALGRDDIPVEINSVRTWSMKACVAGNFQSKGGHGFLVGDAAHQFPPAGGFGLNTGIQDAHNLAWKLKAVANGRLPREYLQTYHQERYPVAIQNTKLSLHNYERTLRTSRALGIDSSHPQLLQQHVKTTGDGLEWFSLGLKFGLAHLGALSKPGHPYGEERISKLHEALKIGAGLPLLFPLHDLGFSYDSLPRQPGTVQASFGDPQKLRVGGRFPHCLLASAQPEQPPTIFSTVDVGSQIALTFEQNHPEAFFTLIKWSWQQNIADKSTGNDMFLSNMLPEYLNNFPLAILYVTESTSNSLSRHHINTTAFNPIFKRQLKIMDSKTNARMHQNTRVLINAVDFQNSLKKAIQDYGSCENILVRPDGHINSIW